MAQLKSPLSTTEGNLIRDTLRPLFDIQILDLDLRSGLLLITYNGNMDLMMVEEKLMQLGLPIQSYAFPNRTPLHPGGTDTGSLA